MEFFRPDFTAGTLQNAKSGGRQQAKNRLTKHIDNLPAEKYNGYAT